ncbi:uncharacterized protein PGTG_19726 [Puccinia graminis f. sp. tritici CRL 75-36-700-3]|uniref:Uncharacterized protein n=1 Tax=Puccinia graminis f. sp. tritici (strain CRL 75-36-700-3 / race SCCL) TaxID=418459 RepID=E3LB17_PUCGT|nr:uncharacterized protein PGTG_19726 [Puccinia graminis f. sp. tritici CRL 75-36-700-3]EFP93742.1 hypothetical protein PGTG_19726 [Puccinia graminis f. sp. tritici CRL 75-36-700-3]
MFVSRAALLTIVFGSPLQHGFVVGMLLGLLLIALLYISRYVLSPLQKKALAAKSKIIPNFIPPDYFPPIQFRNGSKNLGIFDSIITFSQYGPNDLEFTDYDRLAHTYSSPKFSSIIDIELISSLKRTGRVIRSLNDHLHTLGIDGFNAMLVFVFQMIQVTRLLTNSALSHHDELINGFNQSIQKIEQARTETSQQQRRLLAQLQRSVDLAFAVRSGLERWRRQLKLYGINVLSTQAFDQSGGMARSYLQDMVAQALDSLLVSKEHKEGLLVAMREDQKRRFND